MNCQDWEQAIALSLEGEPAPGLQEHVSACASCRELLEGLRSDQAALRRAPFAGPAIEQQVRSGVMRRVQRRPIPRVAWYAAAAAIFAAFVAISYWPAQAPAPTPPPKQVAVVKPPVAPPPATQPPEAVRKKAGMPKPAAMTNAEWQQLIDEFLSPPPKLVPYGSSSEVAMRIQTNNPDIVILWLKEERQGGSYE